jgi:hypothetical protein
MHWIREPAGGQGLGEKQVAVFVGNGGDGLWDDRHTTEPHGNDQCSDSGQTPDRMSLCESCESKAQASLDLARQYRSHEQA